jgi:phytoene dehydrogenase-like protein
MSAFDVAVVGAGHNGLVAAWYLAHAGASVCVVERRPFVGGACVTEELFPGYRFSTCAGILWKLHPKVETDLELGRRGLSWWRLDPATVNIWEDGESLALWRDRRHTQREIRRLSRRDASRYPDWCEFWAQANAILESFDLGEPPSLTELRSEARARGTTEVLNRVLESSVAEVCDHFFEDTRVKAALVHIEDVCDPHAPAGALAEAYYQGHEGDSRLVCGGMGAVTRAMANAAIDEGVDIIVNADVVEIVLRGGRATGIRLADGRSIAASAVVSNLDPFRTAKLLLAPEQAAASIRRDIATRSGAVANMKLHCAMEALPDMRRYFCSSAMRAAQLRVAPSLEHYRRAAQEVAAGVPVSEPLLDIHLPGVYDRTLTDGAGESVSAYVRYAPPRLAQGTWSERGRAIGSAVIAWIARFLPDFQAKLRHWVMMTPAELEARVGLTNGVIHHLDMLPGQLFDSRPVPGWGYETPVEGLYFCGSGAHPGGEVTGVPGHNSARVVTTQLSHTPPVASRRPRTFS